ncbi:MAG: pentapeptide repeat-containing protein [Armatimonadetes bacterium]|nr:pentapeptide repeat-containing protein [Armatimonadota bacterium]
MQLIDRLDCPRLDRGSLDPSGFRLRQCRIGTVDLRGSTVEGAAVFEDCRFEELFLSETTRFACRAVFLRCTFREAVFDTAVFEEGIHLRHCRFLGTARFQGATFGGEVRMEGTRFDRGMNFEYCHFAGALEMEDGEVGGTARFGRAEILGWADFSRTRFEAADFLRCRFQSGAEFREAVFGRRFNFVEVDVAREAIFREARFGGTADFSKVRVGRTLDLVRTRFDRGASLEGAVCGSDVHLQSSIWKGPARMSGLRSVGHVHLDRARMSSPLRFLEGLIGRDLTMRNLRCFSRVDVRRLAVAGRVDLSELECSDSLVLEELTAPELVLEGAYCSRDLLLCGAQVGRLVLDGVQVDNTLDGAGLRVQSELACMGAQVGQLDLGYAQVRGKLASQIRTDPQRGKEEFSFLARGFQARSRYEDMDEATLMERRMSRRSRLTRSAWNGVPCLLEWLFVDMACGYGLRPFRLLATTAVVVLCFGIVYAVGSQNLGGGLGSSVVAFLSPDHSIEFEMPLIAVVESVLGIFLTALFIGTLTRKLAR